MTSPSESPSPEQMWDNFIKHLNEVQPLCRPRPGRPGLPHVSFLGSIKEYRKIFLEANKKRDS